MSKHRVVKIWQPATASFKYHVLEEETSIWTGRKKGWKVLAWDVGEDVAKHNATYYKVKLEEVEDWWGDD